VNLSLFDLAGQAPVVAPATRPCPCVGLPLPDVEEPIWYVDSTRAGAPRRMKDGRCALCLGAGAIPAGRVLWLGHLYGTEWERAIAERRPDDVLVLYVGSCTFSAIEHAGEYHLSRLLAAHDRYTIERSFCFGRRALTIGGEHADIFGNFVEVSLAHRVTVPVGSVWAERLVGRYPVAGGDG
jgi:hypothetical protein